MRIASRDLTGGERDEVMLTSMGNQLMQVAGTDGTYTTASRVMGTTAHRPYLGDSGRNVSSGRPRGRIGKRRGSEGIKFSLQSGHAEAAFVTGVGFEPRAVAGAKVRLAHCVERVISQEGLGEKTGASRLSMEQFGPRCTDSGKIRLAPQHRVEEGLARPSRQAKAPGTLFEPKRST